MLSRRALVSAESGEGLSPVHASIRLGSTTPAVPTNRMIAAKAIPSVTTSWSRRRVCTPFRGDRASLVVVLFAVNPAPWLG